MKEIILRIPLAPPSLNLFYAGQFWAVRKKLADDWHEAVWAVCKEMKIKKITEFPINILTQSFFKSKKVRDTDNTMLANKLVCDGLVGAGIIPDDNTKYVGIQTIMPPIIGDKKDETVVVISSE